MLKKHFLRESKLDSCFHASSEKIGWNLFSMKYVLPNAYNWYIWWNCIWEECDCVEIENNSIVQKLQVWFITFLKSHNAWWEMHISLCGCALQKKKSLQCMCTQKSSHMSIHYLYCSFHYKIITKDLKFLDLSSLLCCQNIILKS